MEVDALLTIKDRLIDKERKWLPLTQIYAGLSENVKESTLLSQLNARFQQYEKKKPFCTILC
ncbi:hypothetical protein CDB3_29770 [Bacillus sp. CDB3]|nr:hypothetical protein CDB3_29770 [Bacillus sp. CDB3]